MTSSASLPDKQKRILEFICSEHSRTGVYPSVREIAAHMDFRSTNTVDYHLRRLEEAGALERGGRRARTFSVGGSGGRDARPSTEPAGARIVQMRPAAQKNLDGEEFSEPGIPLIGRVAAGQPILADQNFDGLVNFSSLFHCDNQTFALRVRGDSMIDAGIRDGDLVVVRNQPKVENGEIAVAVLWDEATVKRVFDEGRRWRLQPENPVLQPMYVEKEDSGFRVAGKVIGVIRKI